MPAKRSSSKRKVVDSDSEERQKLKRTKSSHGSQSQSQLGSQSQSQNEESSSNPQPKNKVLPVHISFPSKESGSLRFACWNICGLAASSKKARFIFLPSEVNLDLLIIIRQGFKYYVEAEDADVLVLSETKVNEEPLDPALTSRYPYRYWSISETKSYAGTAILSKVKPIAVTKTLPGHPTPSSVKGRIITLEFENCYLIGTYVVNAGQNLKTLDAKKEWNVHFEKYIRDLDQKKPVIWCGDLNVAPTAIDLSNAKKNWNKTPGYTEAETTSFKNILNPPEESGITAKFVDVWRQLHPADKHFTYFSYRFNCREKGLGWRLDMFVLSERLVDKVKMCEIRSEIYGASDHCPLVLELEASPAELESS